MLLFKTGVKLNGIKPECCIAICICENVFAIYGGNCFISSVVEGKHSRTSLHYVGFAFDISLDDFHHKDTPAEIREIIATRLTDEYDVILEWTDSVNDHIHIEFQPKLSH